MSFLEYTRCCKRCEVYFQTPHRGGRVCDKCKEERKKFNKLNNIYGGKK